MLALILTIVSTQVNIDVARDSALHYIQEGQWPKALKYAKLVITENPNDYLLLGLFHFANTMDYMPDLNPRIKEAVNSKRAKIYTVWESHSISHAKNIHILTVLMVLYSSAYRKGAYKYAYKVLELDSLNGLAHYVLGHIAEKDGNYSEAIVHYSAALRLDTTLTSIYSKLATIYLIQNEYDSALSYYRMVPYGDVSLNSIHIGEAICEIAEGNINRTQAIADRLGALETTWFVETSLENLTEYMHDYQNDRIAENDTFVFFGPFLGEKAPFQPTQWLAILTAYDIVILTDFQIEKPKQKSTPRPIYPRSAREQGIEGQVVVLAIIDVDGSVKNVEIESTSGCLALDEAALDCVRKWKFTQPRILGIHVPVESVVSVPINFRLIKGW